MAYHLGHPCYGRDSLWIVVNFCFLSQGELTVSVHCAQALCHEAIQILYVHFSNAPLLESFFPTYLCRYHHYVTVTNHGRGFVVLVPSWHLPGSTFFET